jgi:hypothetical protein
MHAGLGLHVAVRVLAADHHGRALDARFLPRLIVEHLARPAFLFTVAEVHAQQHLGPVLRLGAAGSGVNGEDAVAEIVLAGELHRQLDGVDLPLELADQRLDVGFDVLPFALELEEHVQVVRFAVDRFACLDAFLDRGAAAADFLRLLLVVPEAGDAHFTLDFVELPARAG